MTVGIYLLEFNNMNEVYIGQSLDIERRYREHLRELKNNESNYKLLDYYQKYGEPSLHIIEKSLIEDLNILENLYIEEFNSVDEGLNILYKAGSPKLSGINSPHSKLDKEIYINIFKDIVNSNNTLQSISLKYGVSKHIVEHIRLGRTHLWLKEEFPKEYKILEEKIASSKYIVDRYIYNNKTGEIVNVTNISKFCEERGYRGSNLSRMLNGKRKTAYNWELASLQHLKESGINV